MTEFFFISTEKVAYPSLLNYLINFDELSQCGHCSMWRRQVGGLGAYHRIIDAKMQ